MLLCLTIILPMRTLRTYAKQSHPLMAAAAACSNRLQQGSKGFTCNDDSMEGGGCCNLQRTQHSFGTWAICGANLYDPAADLSAEISNFKGLKTLLTIQH